MNLAIAGAAEEATFERLQLILEGLLLEANTGEFCFQLSDLVPGRVDNSVGAARECLEVLAHLTVGKTGMCVPEIDAVQQHR